MPIVCHQCGVCTRFCPNGVIQMVDIKPEKEG
jgi:ferredoxin